MQDMTPGDVYRETVIALNNYAADKLIESWRHVPGRGIVVICADMEEIQLESGRDATMFLAGLSSALTAFHDGQAQR